MNDLQWAIPPSVLHWLEKVPRDRPVVMLVRHSVRGHLPPGRAGNAVPITEAGVSLATELGAKLGSRLASLHASPVLRCLQTADAMRRGANASLPVVADRLLGDPGAFVLDSEIAEPEWRARSHQEMLARLCSLDPPPPGMATPALAARQLTLSMLARAEMPGIHAYVTHDSLVTVTAAHLLGASLGPEDWPWYLEAAFAWREGPQVHFAYRSGHNVLPAAALSPVGTQAALEFAQRELAPLFRSDVQPGRFFLAGGAFKSLLTGREPRDLDLWAPTPADRTLLIAALLATGAQALPPSRFAEAFSWNGRCVEVPVRTEPDTLEERLARFDLALSAVGVEFAPDMRPRAVVSPAALADIEQRRVSLLLPLANPKYVLATIERLHRYAKELVFEVPSEDLEAAWRVFDNETAEGQERMLYRLAQAGFNSQVTAQEAKCRHR